MRWALYKPTLLLSKMGRGKWGRNTNGLHLDFSAAPFTHLPDVSHIVLDVYTIPPFPPSPSLPFAGKTEVALKVFKTTNSVDTC